MKKQKLGFFCFAAGIAIVALSGCAKEKTLSGQTETAESRLETKGSLSTKNQEELLEAQKQASKFAIMVETYDNGKNHVEFPHIEGLVNQEITDWYNAKFQEFKKVCEQEKEEGEVVDSIEEHITVTHQTEDEVSILVEGYWDADGAAHPSAYARAYNIDLKTGESTGITDEIASDMLREYLLKQSKFTSAGDNEIQDEYLQQEIQMMGDWLGQTIENCDYKFKRSASGKMTETGEEPYMYSYKTEDGEWALILPVSHALGDYALLKYK